MNGGMGFLLYVLWSVVALAVTLVLEVLLAMALYIYLDLNHRDFFGWLVVQARNAMNGLLDALSAYPEMFQAANTSLAGEFAAKAFLLLFLGLFASGFIRMVVWLVARLFRRRAA